MKRLLEWVDELAGFIGGGILFLLGVAGGITLGVMVWVFEVFIGLAYLGVRAKTMAQEFWAWIKAGGVR